MPQRIILNYRNSEVLWVTCGYILMSSLLLMIRSEKEIGHLLLIGLFIICVILSTLSCIRNYCETTITDEGVFIRRIFINGQRTYYLDDPKLSFSHNSARISISTTRISVSYNGKVLSQYGFMNPTELKRFYTVTTDLGFKWKKQPK